MIEKTWIPCPEHAQMASTLARLDERTLALKGTQETTLSEVRELSLRLAPVEISTARAEGAETVKVLAQQNAPKWMSAKVSAGALILSGIMALAGLAMAIFGR